MHVPSLSADEGFIYFYLAAIGAQLGAEEFILHCQPNPMQHEPCGLLSNLHISRNLVTTDTVLAIGYEPSSGEPLIQRDRGIFHHSADLYGKLALRVMSGASPSAAFLAEFDLHGAASRAGDNAVRPAPDREIVNAIVGIREEDDCLLQALWLAHDLALHEQL